MNSESPTPESTQSSLTLEPNDTRHLAMLCGQFDGHLRQIESRLGIGIAARGNQFLLSG
ncbi:MAG TPA: PhoH family protein, partial [Halieaceae bacterium]|nr:PhoH family protein [Halieaceae bacterium]